MRVHNNKQYRKFCAYGFLRNQRFFDPFLLLFLQENGLSFTQIGALYGLRMLFQNLFEIPSGIVADAFGRRRAMLFAFTFQLLSFSTFFFSSAFAEFGVAMILFSVADAFRTGTHKAMIFDYLSHQGMSDQRVTYYGHTRAWSQRGAALSALIAAMLVFTTNNYRMVFLFSLLPVIINMLLIYSYPTYLDGETIPLKWDTIRSKFHDVSHNLMATIKNKALRQTTINAALHSGYFKAVKDFLQPVLKTLVIALPLFTGESETRRSALIIGLTYFTIYHLAAFASRLSGRFANKVKPATKALTVTLTMGCLAGVFSGVLLWLNLPAWAVLFYLIIFFVENMRKPIAVSATAKHSLKQQLATTLSAQAQMETLIAALLAAMLGALADIFSLPVALLMVPGGLLLLVPFLIFTQRKTNH